MIEIIFDNQGEKINLGYFLYSSTKNIIIIAFTGTWSELLWARNFDFPQIPASMLNNFTEGVDVHRGIYSLYIGVQNQLRKLMVNFLQPHTQVIITGHSLGGTLSNLAHLISPIQVSLIFYIIIVLLDQQ